MGDTEGKRGFPEFNQEERKVARDQLIALFKSKDGKSSQANGVLNLSDSDLPPIIALQALSPTPTHTKPVVVLHAIHHVALTRT